MHLQKPLAAVLFRLTHPLWVSVSLSLTHTQASILPIQQACVSKIPQCPPKPLIYSLVQLSNLQKYRRFWILKRPWNPPGFLEQPSFLMKNCSVLKKNGPLHSTINSFK